MPFFRSGTSCTIITDSYTDNLEVSIENGKVATLKEIFNEFYIALIYYPIFCTIKKSTRRHCFFAIASDTAVKKNIKNFVNSCQYIVSLYQMWHTTDTWNAGFFLVLLYRRRGKTSAVSVKVQGDTPLFAYKSTIINYTRIIE